MSAQNPQGQEPQSQRSTRESWTFVNVAEFFAAAARAWEQLAQSGTRKAASFCRSAAGELRQAQSLCDTLHTHTTNFERVAEAYRRALQLGQLQVSSPELTRASAAFDTMLATKRDLFETVNRIAITLLRTQEATSPQSAQSPSQSNPGQYECNKLTQTALSRMWGVLSRE